MADYEIYRKIVTKEVYFSNWDIEKLESLDEAEMNNRHGRDFVYNRYTLKAQILQRAKFKCQHTGCKTPNAPLTWHHIKFQKNDGKDSIRNGICLCKECHDSYHQANLELVLPSDNTVPKHVSGHKFKLEKPDKPMFAYFSKQFIKSQKCKRKELKHLCGMRISMDEWLELMKFFEYRYE